MFVPRLHTNRKPRQEMKNRNLFLTNGKHEPYSMLPLTFVPFRLEAVGTQRRATTHACGPRWALRAPGRACPRLHKLAGGLMVLAVQAEGRQAGAEVRASLSRERDGAARASSGCERDGAGTG